MTEQLKRNPAVYGGSIKHKARPTELAFDRPLDFRLVSESTTDWARVKADQEQKDRDGEEASEK